ncbi:MAG TPA: COX15/CtaA family protein [Burkholderiales bacterium]|nr:COX15/CtaA family protein [Burkholderiales bacterium]
MSRAYRPLVVAAAGLAFVVVVVGAYVRLSDAGLGCPDWPFCYGQPVPSDIAGDALGRAWKEMGHRYLAGTLGLLIVVLAVLSWKLRRSPWLVTSIVALVLIQATLGAWTVTMLLKPAIVTAHLVGGMTILGALTWLALSQFDHFSTPPAQSLRVPASAALCVLAVQIALGGWVSSNYAALACPDVPLCMGRALPPMDFANAFHVLRELGQTPQGELLSREALTAIHWTHRMFALVAVAVIGWAAYRAARFSRIMGLSVGALLAVQFSIGVANVVVSRPLALAAAHNAGAAALLVALVVLNFFAFRATGATHPAST